MLATLELLGGDLRRSAPNDEMKDLAREISNAIDVGKQLTRRFLVFGRGDAEVANVGLDDAITRARPLLERDSCLPQSRLR